MDQSVSDLIRALRIVMIAGLVLVHFGHFPGDPLSPFTGVVDAKYFIPASINSFFTYFFLSSVPILSMISGFLFSLNGKPDYLTVLKRKSITVALPSIAWMTLWLIFAYALYIASTMTSKLDFYVDLFSTFSYMDLLNAMAGITDNPIAIQFWFIHDLIISIIISPLLYLFIKRASYLPIAIVLLLWIFEWEPPLLFNLKVITFFMIGMYLTVYRVPISSIKHNSPLSICVPIFIMLTLLRIYLPMHFDGSMPYETIIELLLRISGSVSMVIFMLKIREYLPSIYQWLVDNSGYAFFIFAAHYPLVIYIKKVLWMTGAFNTEIGNIALWVVTPIITVVLSAALAYFSHTYTPKVYQFMNGQRSL